MTLRDFAELARKHPESLDVPLVVEHIPADVDSVMITKPTPENIAWLEPSY